MTEKNDIFVKHIERHLIDQKMYGAKVVCKICGKDIEQIYNDYLRAMGRYKKKNRTKELIEENKQLKETIALLREKFLKQDDTPIIEDGEQPG